MCNGGLFFDCEEGELLKKHFFHNEQLYTSNMFRHVLAYIREVEDAFQDMHQQHKKFEKVGLKKIKIC